MKIIINADDLGISREVNDATFALAAERRITSATIVVNGVAVEDAATRLKEYPHCSFGVHLNVSEFRPLTSSAELRPILGDDGCFAGNRLREIKVTSALRAAIFAEWVAQVERLENLGVRVSHFDSHHHMHTVPMLLPLLRRLQSRFGVRKARLTLNIYPPDVPVSIGKRVGKGIWNLALRTWCGMRTTDAFTSFETFARVDKESLGRINSAELMVHPGGKDFDRETKMLWGDWRSKLPFAAELINYNEL